MRYDETAEMARSSLEGLVFEELVQAGSENQTCYMACGSVIRAAFLAVKEHEPDIDFEDFAKCLILSACVGLSAQAHVKELKAGRLN
jgi:hypothetical protein